MVVTPSFAQLLREYRKAARLTQEELANRAGLSVRAISDLERGAKTRPQAHTVQTLEHVLGLSEEDQTNFEAAVDRRRGPYGVAHSPSLSTREGASSPLVGRARELDILRRHLQGNGPPVLLLAGAPGIGKTHLLRQMVQEAATFGLSTLDSGCQRKGGQDPYTPILEGLTQHVAGLPRTRLNAIARAYPWLQRLLPELTTFGQEALPSLPVEQERRLLFASVAHLLNDTGGPKGTALFLDDLQWAGPDALHLLYSLATEARRLSLRVVAAYRTTDVQPQDPLAGTLADLVRAGLAWQVTVEPLSITERRTLLGQLLGRHASEDLLDQILECAGGLPFYLVSYAQALQAGNLTMGVDARIPWDLHQSLRERIAGLPPQAQVVLGIAAVIGRIAPYHLLKQVANLPEEQLAAALDDCCRAQLLLSNDDMTYRFGHDLVREVLETDLGTVRRSAIHKRIGQALEQSAGELPAEALAYHYSRSDDVDKAVHWLERAGDLAQARNANSAAAEHYRALMTHVDALRWTRERGRARLKLGAALGTMARHDEAIEMLQEAAELYRVVGDAVDMAHTLGELAQVHAFRGTAGEGWLYVENLIGALDLHAPPSALCALYQRLAFLLFSGARYKEELAAAERAAGFAQQVEDNGLRAAVGEALGLALLAVGRVDDAREIWLQALELSEVVGGPATMTHAQVLTHLAATTLVDGDLETGGLYARRAMHASEAVGSPVLTAVDTAVLGLFYFLTGDWKSARLHFERSRQVSETVGEHSMAPFAHFGLGWLHLVRGELKEARQVLEEGLGIAEHTGNLQTLRWVAVPLVELEVAEGNPAAGISRLASMLDRPGLQEWDVNPLLPRLAEAYLAGGHTDRAEALLAHSIARLQEQSSQLWLTDAFRVQGILMARLQRWREATAAFDRAVAGAQAMGYSWALGRALYARGRLHASLGEGTAAAVDLARALNIFCNLGARPSIEEVASALESVESGW